MTGRSAAMPVAQMPVEENVYQRVWRELEEAAPAKRAAFLADTENPYRNWDLEHGGEFEARLAARRADPDNPYRKYVEDEERRAVQNSSDVTLEMQIDNTINLPAVLVASGEPMIKRKIKSIAAELYEHPPYHIILGDCVVFVIRSRGEDLMFTKKGAYRYLNGLWSIETEGLSSWLNVEIEIAAKIYRQPSTIRLISETRAWILRQEQLSRNYDDIKWDAHGLVPTKSGLVNPRTGIIRPIQPDDYCTWRIETEYSPDAKCPWWLQMLEDVFADRDPNERAATISVIQELLGVGLIDDKPREISRALIFLGGSNFGKSGLLEVMSGLFGQDFNSTPIEALEGPHGMMGFLKRRPWVLHEAFDQRKWHFSSDVKTIVTGEPIHINVKNGPMLSQRVRAPIFWGTNHPPQFKEATKAITNRLVLIECKREFFEDNPVGAAKEAFRLGLGKPSNLVLEKELPGLLAWAMVGLKRALERGRLILTNEMSESIVEIRRDSNLVDGFLTDCCFYDPDYRIAVPDFCLAFAAWWLENKGENRVAPSNESIGKALKAMADPRIALGGDDLRDGHRRYHVGITLNAEGLSFHEAGLTNRDLEGKIANASLTRDVNERLSAQWLEKESIKTMRRRQGMGGVTVEVMGV